MGDVEYVNVFIQKQKLVIDDLMNKGIHLETRLHIAEKKVEELTNQLAVMQQQDQQDSLI